VRYIIVETIRDYGGCEREKVIVYESDDFRQACRELADRCPRTFGDKFSSDTKLYREVE